METAGFHTGNNNLDVALYNFSVWSDSAAQCSECTSPTLSFATTISDKSYLISAPSVTTEAFKTNLGKICFSASTYPTVVNFAYQKDSVNIGSSPACLTYNLTTQTFTYSIPSDLA